LNVVQDIIEVCGRLDDAMIYHNDPNPLNLMEVGPPMLLQIASVCFSLLQFVEYFI